MLVEPEFLGILGFPRYPKRFSMPSVFTAASALRGVLRERRLARGGVAFLLATSLVVSSSACSPGGDGSVNDVSNNDGGGAFTDSEKPKVLTTFTVLADIARNVAGDHLEVESLTKPGSEIHGYEPTPGDLRRAANADLVLNNGLNLELWFEQFMADVDAPRATVSEGVEVMDITEDAYAGKPNPHAWMSPNNVAVYADNMAQAFAELDPENAQDFRANAHAYQEQLESIQNNLVEGIESLPSNQRVLVTCEGAFSYLAKDAGLEEAYIWPVNSENQATPQQIADVINLVNTNDVPAVFCESTVANDPMLRVVEATGATFGGVLYVDSLSLDDGPVPTYLDLISHDVDTILAGLAKK